MRFCAPLFPLLLLGSVATHSEASSVIDEVTVVAKRSPPALTGPLNAGLEIVKSFPARSGLTGWVWKDRTGQQGVFFSTADGQTLVVGTVLGDHGEDWTQRYIDEQVPKPDLEALWSKLEGAEFVTSGTLENPSQVIYAFLDPNCVYCFYLTLALEPYLKSGLQVRWVPVGLLREDSAAKAAAVLAGGESALRELQATFENGGLPGIEVTAPVRATLDTNLSLMRAAHVRGTPGIVYQDAQGRVHVKEGMPKLGELAQITRLPAPSDIDPRLERFK